MDKPKSKISKYEIVKETPKKIVRVPGFLSGNFRRDVLEEFRGRAKVDYGNVSVLDIFGGRDTVTGSNPYSVVLSNQILRQIGLRTTTPADIEGLLKLGDLDLSEIYVDTGLVLRNGNEPNYYLAKDLKRQLGKNKLPAMIPLIGLDLRVDDRSPSGLAFDLREDAEIIYDEILDSGDGKFNPEDINAEIGLPKKLDGGSREFVTRASGLSGFCLGINYRLLSSRELEYSGEDGRIVIVDGRD
jgi:hypothetical protein